MSVIKLDIAVSVVLIGVVLALLPKSPFQYFLDSMSGIGSMVNMRYVNWFVPFGEMLAIGQAWLLCVGIYYAYMYIMRFIKLIQ